MIKHYILQSAISFRDYSKFSKLFNRYKEYTMIPKKEFIQNLSLINQFRNIKGDVVECGVWRGGFSAAMANLLGNEKKYFLFDSFEGLPEAKAIDGKSAIDWQKNKQSATYFDNCTAEIDWAKKAMNKSKSVNYEIIKGWFKDTLPNFNGTNEIAILRLDGDWYESTMECLVNLYPKVKSGGLIIIDDYFLWDGCAKAVHEYIAKNMLPIRIRQYNNGNLFYMIKP